MTTCPNCNILVPETFCPNCGAAVSVPPAVPLPVYAPMVGAPLSNPSSPVQPIQPTFATPAYPGAVPEPYPRRKRRLAWWAWVLIVLGVLVLVGMTAAIVDMYVDPVKSVTVTREIPKDGEAIPESVKDFAAGESAYVTVWTRSKKEVAFTVEVRVDGVSFPGSPINGVAKPVPDLNQYYFLRIPLQKMIRGQYVVNVLQDGKVVKSVNFTVR